MKATGRRKCLYACLLVAAAAANIAQGAAAQAATCPSLTANDIGSSQALQALWEGVIKACSEYEGLLVEYMTALFRVLQARVVCTLLSRLSPAA
jgi:hypothetical protein